MTEGGSARIHPGSQSPSQFYAAEATPGRRLGQGHAVQPLPSERVTQVLKYGGGLLALASVLTLLGLLLSDTVPDTLTKQVLLGTGLGAGAALGTAAALTGRARQIPAEQLREARIRQSAREQRANEVASSLIQMSTGPERWRAGQRLLGAGQLESIEDQPVAALTELATLPVSQQQFTIGQVYRDLQSRVAQQLRPAVGDSRQSGYQGGGTAELAPSKAWWAAAIVSFLAAAGALATLVVYLAPALKITPEPIISPLSGAESAAIGAGIGTALVGGVAGAMVSRQQLARRAQALEPIRAMEQDEVSQFNAAMGRAIDGHIAVTVPQDQQAHINFLVERKAIDAELLRNFEANPAENLVAMSQHLATSGGASDSRNLEAGFILNVIKRDIFRNLAHDLGFPLGQSR
jgi:hypothetical protein